ncbi:MAG: YciI family protein [Chloroflexi bacterium]|nr:YciI family protein [Chloroflexota bacterium]
MAQFGLLYVGEPQFSSPEEGQANAAQYVAWLNGLGDAVVNRGIPMGPPTRVDASGVSSDPRADRLTGLTIVEADDMDAAIAIAKTCPYVDVAALDVVQIFEMNM